MKRSILVLTGYVKIRSRDFYTHHLEYADRLYLVGRGLSCLFALITVLLAFWVARRLLSETEGLIAAFLTAVIPMQATATLYAKIDSMIVLWGFIVIALCLPLWENRSRSGLAVGIAVGLAAATKYTAGIYFLLPLTLLVWTGEGKLKFLIACGIGGVLGFLIGCPVALVDFPSVWHYVHGLSKSVADPPTDYPDHRPWALGYLRVFLPFGLGYPLFITFLLSLFWIAVYGEPKERWLLIGFLLTYGVLTSPARQFIMYALPLLPYIILISARGCAIFMRKLSHVPLVGPLCISLILGATLFYSASYMRLFYFPDERVKASEWIRTHIPPGASVGIVMSFAWTPPILRSYTSPYRLIDPSENLASLEEQTKRLQALQADYFVISNFEIREALRKGYYYYPPYEASLREITERRYKKIMAFDDAHRFSPFLCPRGDPPWDWLFPSPSVDIYARRSKATALRKTPCFEIAKAVNC